MSRPNTASATSVAKENNIISVRKMCVIALAIVLNVIGGHIALLFHLPIYLDSIGTIMIAMLYGPVYGMLPPLLYGLVMGFSIDIYSLYYMPVGMILGLTTGLAARYFSLKGWRIIPGALMITIPGTIVSSIITAVLFGGITSSASTIIVQLLNKAGLGLTASVFVVQIMTDYLDRILSLVLVAFLLRMIPRELYSEQDG
ncbi:MAG: ECF transporter S component [Lachnospiraceae bacterium]|nr:ECF transporter S component [Lachnospiraceae bacterium]